MEYVSVGNVPIKKYSRRWRPVGPRGSEFGTFLSHPGLGGVDRVGWTGSYPKSVVWSTLGVEGDGETVSRGFSTVARMNMWSTGKGVRLPVTNLGESSLRRPTGVRRSGGL